MVARVRREFSFSAGLYINKEFVMDTFKATVYMDIIEEEPDQQWIALERMKYLFEEALSNTVFVNKDDKKVINGLLDIGLKVTTLLSDPFEQAIAIPIYHKLNSICEGKFTITNMMFKSHLSDQVEFLLDDDMISPYDDKNGWWKQSNTSVIDRPNKKEKIVKLEKENDWHKFGLEWKDQDKDSATIIFTMEAEKT